MVDLLIKHGANTDSRDHLGWTANDHAGFRGYLTMFRCIETRDNPTVDKIGKTPRPLLWRPAPAESPPWLPPTQKRCDTSQGQILVSLGVSNTRSSAKAIDLNMMQWCEENGLRCQAGFALEIDVIGGYGPRRLVVLPVLVDMTNQPIVFSSTDPHEAKIVFRLFEVCDYRKPDLSLVGSGVAILKTLQERLSPKHESLVRDHTIPILAKDTLDMVASVVFSFLIVNPFAHTPLSTTATHGFWRSDGQTAVVGHRGSGANTASRTTLQIGENTLQSFLSAVASGASCIEFDVQLTKDLIPVVFHDFLVMETGGDVPLHTLTRDQFIHFSSNQRFRSDQLGNAGRGYRQATEGLNGAGLRARSYSENLDDVDLVGEIRQRMRYTEEGLKDEVRGNLRGYSIQEPSTTLEELLMQLPASVSFNLEMSRCSLPLRNIDIRSDIASRIPYAMGSRRPRHGCLRHRIKSLRRHHSQHGVSLGWETQYHLLVIQSGDMYPAIGQTANLSCPLHQQSRVGPHRRYSCEQFATGNPFRKSLESSRHCYAI